MKTITITCTLAGAALILLIISTNSYAMGDSGTGYWQSSGDPVTNGYGECYRNKAWNQDSRMTGCGPNDGMEFSALEMAPVPQETTRVERILSLQGNSKAYFGFDESALTPEAQTQLDQLLSSLNPSDEVTSVVISSHTDQIGSSDYNMKLSQQRGDAVRDYLVSRGIDSGRIEVVAYGESSPMVSCFNQGGSEQLIDCLSPNRRTQIRVEYERPDMQIVTP